MKIGSRWLLLVAVVLLASCGRNQATPPGIAIDAPAAGAQVPEGETVLIRVTAQGDQGIERVELGVDSVLLYTVDNPNPAGSTAFMVERTWQATTLGSHTVMAVAYDTTGTASSPAVVSVSVTDRTAATIAPDEPTATQPPDEPQPIAPTPTWTPIAIQPAETLAPPTNEPDVPSVPTATATKPASSERPSSPGPITGFETFGIWKRGDEANGTLAQSSEQVHEGTSAAKLAYNFPTDGNDYVVFLQDHKLGGQPSQISAWVYGDGSAHFLNTWIRDNQGETWQFTFGRVTHTGWQQMTAWLDTSAKWPAGPVGGPSNGQVDYPIDFRALVLDDAPDKYKGQGVIYIDDLRCDSGGAPPAPKPTADAPAATINFRVDQSSLTTGSCTWLRWDVDNVREVYLDGQGVAGHGQQQICPTTTTTYRLQIVHQDGRSEEKTLTVTVS